VLLLPPQRGRLGSHQRELRNGRQAAVCLGPGGCLLASIASVSSAECVAELQKLKLARVDRRQRIIARVREIPPGFVRTYGDCSPGAPRLTGAVLAAHAGEALPWHRVVRADGSLAKGARQRELLEAEGVPFRGERVEMRTARLPDL
jgi:methylated-DNA-protein-cysteine methyltransferase-like protein